MLKAHGYRSCNKSTFRKANNNDYTEADIKTEKRKQIGDNLDALISPLNRRQPRLKLPPSVPSL